MEIIYQPIGVIHSPFSDIRAMPIQPGGAGGVQGMVELLPEFEPGLQDLAGFSHLILLYHFHRVRAAELVVTPFLDSEPHGIFATRAPKRPNPIGLSVVRLVNVSANMLYIENVDIVDGTPLLDIKPYVPDFDHFAAERVGWLTRAGTEVQHKRSDDRFR
jgi:tRNA-Thr(GGU) m(6)t(6)A37 methyltransferase TsaA